MLSQRKDRLAGFSSARLWGKRFPPVCHGGVGSSVPQWRPAKLSHCGPPVQNWSHYQPDRAHTCALGRTVLGDCFFFLSWDIHFDARGDGFAFKCNRLFFFSSLCVFFFCLRLAFLWVSNQYVNIDAVPHLVRRPGAVTEG